MASNISPETMSSVRELGKLLVQARMWGKFERSRTHFDEFNEILVNQREKTGQADADLLLHAFKNAVAAEQKQPRKELPREVSARK